jgi:hypothetical protein
MPPNFESDFLRDRDSYFWDGYQWPFYVHIVSGPCTLLLGMILLSGRFRQRIPQWHRRLGRVQTAMVLLLVTPSGMWMAFYAETGAVAGFGFGSLAAVTGLCFWFGWRSAVRRRFVEHRRWMWRGYLLLCSAVVLRLMAGVVAVTNIEGEWPYPAAAWSSWILPLAINEFFESRKLKKKKRGLQSGAPIVGQQESPNDSS